MSRTDTDFIILGDGSAIPKIGKVWDCRQSPVCEVEITGARPITRNGVTKPILMLYNENADFPHANTMAFPSDLASSKEGAIGLRINLLQGEISRLRESL